MKIKSSDQKGFSHFELLVIIAVVAAVSLCGVLVYFKNASTVHASSWTEIGYSEGVSIAACRNYISAYGGVYQITTLFTKKASTFSHTYKVVDIRNGRGISSKQSSNYYDGVAGSLNIDQSIYDNDSVKISVGNGSWSFLPSSVAKWGVCSSSSGSSTGSSTNGGSGTGSYTGGSSDTGSRSR